MDGVAELITISTCAPACPAVPVVVTPVVYATPQVVCVPSGVIENNIG